MTANSGCVNCTAFNHNGHLLVTGAADGMIRVFGKAPPVHGLIDIDGQLQTVIKTVLLLAGDHLCEVKRAQGITQG